MRPEVIISTIESDVDSKDKDNDNESLIMVGSKVRIIREPFFGLIGSVSNLPKDLVKMKTETLVLSNLLGIVTNHENEQA